MRKAVIAAMLSAAMLFGVAIRTQAIAQEMASDDEVSVVGNHLLRGGRPWLPHGFYQIAFEQPPTFSGKFAFWKIASQSFFPGEYTNMHRFGADSVRIQVAQTGLDPQNHLATPQYRDDVLAAVRAARAAGLIVIISVQDERQTGEARPADLPNEATQRVWRIIAPAFGRDRGVMFELFNEPRPAPSPANWRAWADAMNHTIETVRATGAVNVVVAGGLGVGQYLDGAPLLRDPLAQVAYTSHPYAVKATGPADQTPAVWDAKFGAFARRAPVIISEWGLGYYCDAQTPQATLDFIGYLQAHDIGLEIGTWDWPPRGFRSARYGFPHSMTSSFLHPDGSALPCDAPGYGPGKVIESWYRTRTPPTRIE